MINLAIDYKIKNFRDYLYACKRRPVCDVN